MRSHGRRRVSLRSRVTWLAASCVAGAVALVSLGAYLTVRQNLYDQIDSSLERKAFNVVHSEAELKTPAGERLFPAAFLSLTDVQFAVVGKS